MSGCKSQSFTTTPVLSSLTIQQGVLYIIISSWKSTGWSETIIQLVHSRTFTLLSRVCLYSLDYGFKYPTKPSPLCLNQTWTCKNVGNVSKNGLPNYSWQIPVIISVDFNPGAPFTLNNKYISPPPWTFAPPHPLILFYISNRGVAMSLIFE